MSKRFAAIPRLAEIFVFIDHFWLRAALVSHSQPLSKCLRPLWYETLNGSKNSIFLGTLKILEG